MEKMEDEKAREIADGMRKTHEKDQSCNTTSDANKNSTDIDIGLNEDRTSSGVC